MGEDAEAEGGKEDRSDEGALDSGVAQAEETSKVPREAHLARASAVVAMVEGAGTGSERDESKWERVPDSYTETPQDNCVSENSS